MEKPKLTTNRIAAAFAIAIIADIIQLPINLVTFTGILAIPGEFADIMVDLGVMGLTSALLGFHWILLPSLFVEIIPGLDLCPTWTASVAFLVWQRKNERARVSVTPVEIRDAEVVRETTRHTVPPLLVEARTVSTNKSPVEDRLQRLNDMLNRQIITQAEYNAKRQEILTEV